MFIPRSFKLFTQTIKVVYKRDLMDKEGLFGKWDLNRNTIYLQQSTRKRILTKEQVELTLVHEATHAFLDLAGYDKLSRDEKLVSGLSNMIHEFINQIH